MKPMIITKDDRETIKKALKLKKPGFTGVIKLGKREFFVINGDHNLAMPV